MVSKQFKVLEIVDGKEYCFSAFAFKNSLCEIKKEMKSNGENMASEELYGQLADAAHVSVDSIKNWMYAKNGPGDLQTVKLLAEYLKKDYKDLLRQKEKIKMSSNYTESQNTVNNENTKDVIRVVYQKMCAMMDMAVRELCNYDYDSFSEYEAVYIDMLRTLHKSMLDIPIDIYLQMNAIAENELHLYMHGDSGMADIWDFNEYTEFCEEMKKKSPDISEYFCQVIYMQKLSKDFYRKMREILKDYLVE